jgi:pimeloyl-ACP methyl ester carboxylesterase
MPGTIILLDGISGVRFIRRAYSRWLPAAGLEHNIVKFPWSLGLVYAPFFVDLWHTRHQQRSAERLATLIQSTLVTRPGEPLHLIGHSGGAAIIAYALARLSPAELVTSAVLLNAGLSPQYDLTTAISRTTAGLLAVSSYLDFFMLGFGTSLIGTMDRRHSPSAGMLGFWPPTAIPYSRLHQWRWRPASVRTMGWWGWHLSAANRGLIAAVANWLRECEC